MGSVERVRRPEIADLMLLATVMIWSLNFTVTKYVLSHGFKPLAYGGLRWGEATALRRRYGETKNATIIILGAAAVGIFLNQVGFVYGTKLTTATTVALIFGTLPILTALFAAAAGIERLHSRFWVAAAVSFTGVCLVAAGAKGGIGGDFWGYALVLLGAATWAAYSVAIAPLMSHYTASRISAYTLAIGAVLLLVAGAPQLASQDYGSLPSLVWVAYVFAVLGPLCLTNLLWFNSIEQVGPSRASLYANLQPFLGAIFALLILSESITALQVGGGLLIAAGIVLSRREQPAVLVQESA